MLPGDQALVCSGKTRLSRQRYAQERESAMVRLLRLQHKPVGGVFFDCRAAEDERGVLTFGPQWQKIAVVRASRLARLARSAGEHGAIPIGKVKNVAIGSAIRLQIPRAARGIRRESVPPSPDRS